MTKQTLIKEAAILGVAVIAGIASSKYSTLLLFLFVFLYGSYLMFRIGFAVQKSYLEMKKTYADKIMELNNALAKVNSSKTNEETIKNAKDALKILKEAEKMESTSHMIANKEIIRENLVHLLEQQDVA